MIDGKILGFTGDQAWLFDIGANTYTSILSADSYPSNYNCTFSILNGNLYALGGEHYLPSSTDLVVNPNSVFIIEGLNRVANNQLFACFDLFPNPTTGLVMVHSSLEGETSLTIANAIGQTTEEIKHIPSGDFTLDLSNLPTGTYFARLTSGGSIVTKMIVKQ